VNGGNNRTYRRYALAVDAVLVHGGQSLPIRTRDLSRGGMCFALSNPLPVGDVLEMSLSLVSDKDQRSAPLGVRARVVWCTPLTDGRFQIGASFLGLTAEQRSYLDVFLRFLRDSVEMPAESPEDGDLFE
jgi:hypothetical protein